MKSIQISMFLAAALLFSMCSPKVGQNIDATGKEQKKEQADAAFRSTPPEAGPARSVEIGESTLFELDNGLKVIVVENHKLPKVSYQLYIDRDYLVEGEIAGMTGIVGELIKAGTTSKSKSEIDEKVDFIGGSLSTNSRGGFASSLTKHTDDILALFAEVILSPSFPEDEFEKLKKQTISGLQTQKDSPDAISSNVTNALLYGKDHPYGEISTETTVSNVTLDACKAYYETYFKPNEAYMVVVGDIRPADARSKVEKYFGEWNDGEVPEHSYEMPSRTKATEVDFVDKAGAVQSVIKVAHVVDLQPGHPDVIKSRVMNTILGSGFSGRLFKNLREDKAYTYGAYSSLSSDDLVANFSASASVRNEVTDSAIVEFLFELNRMRTEPVTESELELAKNYIAGSFARSLESPQTVANFALNTLRYNLPEDYYETYLAKLDAVSIADVQAMAQKYIKPDEARIVVVGNKDEVSEKLARFDKADGKITYYDVYANEVKPTAAMTGDLPPGEKVIMQYLEAIGGKEALESVKSVEMLYSMDMMGQKVEIRSKHKAPNMVAMEMTGQGGMTFMKQKFDGEKGQIEQMGQKMDATPDQIESFKEQAKIFGELDYLTDAYTLETTGLENVEGKDCYKVIVTDTDGDKSTQFYDKASGLKIRTIEVQDGGGGQMLTVTNDFSDYKEIDGVKFPSKMRVSGAMPMPMNMELVEVKVNPDLDDAEFKVE